MMVPAHGRGRQGVLHSRDCTVHGEPPVLGDPARMHALYDRDEERSDHSTVDDIFGVFQVVTIGTWSFFAVTHSPACRTPP